MKAEPTVGLVWVAILSGACGAHDVPPEASVVQAAGADAVAPPARDAGAHGSCGALLGPSSASSAWVHADANGHLAYKADAKGNRILDYSHAGYMGGGVALPSVPVAKEVSPSGGSDDTNAIQSAIDAVSALPLKNGFRGAVLLAAGTYSVPGTLRIRASGVVLRGSGSGHGGTLINLTGAPHRFLQMEGAGSWASTGASATITDAYVPSGAMSFHVDDSSPFAPGDTILITRFVTAPWVHFMEMDTLVRNGKPQTWIAPGSPIETDRTVANVQGKAITLDAPLSDDLDAAYVTPPGVSVRRYQFAGRIAQVGFESMRVVAPPSSTPITQPQFQLFTMSAIHDSWVKDIVVQDTTNTASISPTGKRITIQDLEFTRSLPANGSAGYPLELTINGTQILVNRGSMHGDEIYTWSTAARVTGPNVVLGATASGAHNRIEPHMRWATGLLVDGVRGGDEMNLYNRNTAGSGHGWAIGWGVLWNCGSGTIDVEQPPGSQNWAIGCDGRKGSSSAPGIYESQGTPVTPSSLYLAQLCDRLGPQAVAAITHP